VAFAEEPAREVGAGAFIAPAQPLGFPAFDGGALATDALAFLEHFGHPASLLFFGDAALDDATTLEANAALRSIVRRDTGESYQDFLTKLAQASGIETPTRGDLARMDRKRKNKGSNDDWTHPHDPDAKITKMKDGRTHLAHKAEHAVDLETGAIVGVTVQMPMRETRRRAARH